MHRCGFSGRMCTQSYRQSKAGFPGGRALLFRGDKVFVTVCRIRYGRAGVGTKRTNEWMPGEERSEIHKTNGIRQVLCSILYLVDPEEVCGGGGGGGTFHPSIPIWAPRVNGVPGRFESLFFRASPVHRGSQQQLTISFFSSSSSFSLSGGYWVWCRFLGRAQVSPLERS